MRAPRATTIEATPSMRKNHCQEWSPATPLMVVRMPAARKPEMMLEMVLPACQMAMRVGFSCLVYQEDVTDDRVRYGGLWLKHFHVCLLKVIPGKKGASANPVKKRHAANPAPLSFIGVSDQFSCR